MCPNVSFAKDATMCCMKVQNLNLQTKFSKNSMANAPTAARNSHFYP